MRAPSLSVIIPIFRAERTLARVLAALEPQLRPDVEVLAVDSSGVESARALEQAHPWLRVLGLAQRTLPGRARNLGAARARGSHLLFLDADAVPDRTWLERMLLHAGADNSPAVAGAVRNGTPRSRIGTTSYLLEFSEWIPERRGIPFHGATCNLLVRRSSFESAGGFCEDVWPGEDTILTVQWGRRNRLGFAKEAGVSHLNRTSLDELLRHQYRLGRSFASVCDRADVPYARFSRWPLLAAAPMLRMGALGVRVSGQLRPLRELGLLSPLLAVGLSAWTAGVASARRDDAAGNPPR